MAASFPDIEARHAWAVPAIDYMLSKNVVNGYYEDGTFRPDRTVTRAEFIKMLNVTFGLTAKKAYTYTDVKSTDWFAPYVEQATAQGYLLSYGTMLNPNGALSRQEAAALLVRYLEPDTDKKADPGMFTDYNSIKATYRDYVLLAAGIGLINGYEDSSFRPDRTLTRAEALAILYRAAGTICNDNLVESEAGAGKDNAVITKSNVTVTGAVFEGRVLISEGVTGGVVTLNECQIGELIVRGTPTLILNGCTVDNFIVDSAAGHTASVSILNGTAVKDMTLKTPADITTAARTTLANLTVEKTAARSSVSGSGTFTKAVINASGFVSEKVPTQYTLAKGISATFAEKVYTTGSEPVAGDTGFAMQPSSYATSVKCYLSLSTVANGKVQYYFTNTKDAPASALFASYYNAAVSRNYYTVTANRSVDIEVAQTSAVDDYSYVVVMFTDANGKNYQPVVVGNAASDGFVTTPTISTTGSFHYLSYTPIENGTVYYYYTNSATTLTVSSFTTTHSSNATAYKGELAAVKGQAASNRLSAASNVSGYSYVAVMMMDSKNNQYQPVLVPVNGGSSATASGFSEAPYANTVANGVALGFTASYSGTVEYYFTDSATVPTSAQFDGMKSLSLVTLTGSVTTTANSAYYGSLLNSVSTATYPYIVVRLKTTGGVTYNPVVVRIGGSSVVPDQPGAAGSGFTTQPVVSYTGGKFTIRYAAPANSTLYYYLTSYSVAPTAKTFTGNYNAATGSTIAVKTGGMLAANGTTQTAQTVLSTSLGASYDYMVIMLQQGNTQYNPIIVTIPDVEDAVATSNGFSVGPVYNTYQSQENYYQHQLEFITSVTGTLWYYFTNDDKLPTAAAVKENVRNGGEGIIEANTMSVVKGTAVKLPLVFTSAPPAYMVVMLSDLDTSYQPMIVPTSGTGGSTNITTGFFRAPTVSTAGSTPTLSYEANETGKLYYFFTNDSSALTTMWDFFGESTSRRGYYSSLAEGVKGVVDIKVGKGTVALPTSRSVAGYSHVVIMMQSAAGMPGGYRAPQIISLNGSSSGTGNPSTSGSIGFNEYPYISGNSLYVTPSARGTIYYCFTDSNTTDALYEPIKALAGLGLGNMDADRMSSYLATSGNGASAPVSYPGYRQTITLLSSSLMGYKYLAVWTVTSDNKMTSPAFVALSTYSGGNNGGNTGGTAAGTNGFSSAPQFYNWSGQITFTPSVSGQVAYFFTNGTTNYSTDQAFRNAYILENTATSMIVSAGQGAVIPANTNYKYIWIMLYTSTQYYTPVRLQIK